MMETAQHRPRPRQVAGLSLWIKFAFGGLQKFQATLVADVGVHCTDLAFERRALVVCRGVRQGVLIVFHGALKRSTSVIHIAYCFFDRCDLLRQVQTLGAFDRALIIGQRLVPRKDRCRLFGGAHAEL